MRDGDTMPSRVLGDPLLPKVLRGDPGRSYAAHSMVPWLLIESLDTSAQFAGAHRLPKPQHTNKNNVLLIQT